jgi:hypothetical protein
VYNPPPTTTTTPATPAPYTAPSFVQPRIVNYPPVISAAGVEGVPSRPEDRQPVAFVYPPNAPIIQPPSYNPPTNVQQGYNSVNVTTTTTTTAQPVSAPAPPPPQVVNPYAGGNGANVGAQNVNPQIANLLRHLENGYPYNALYYYPQEYLSDNPPPARQV